MDAVEEAGYTLTGIACSNQPATAVQVPIGTSVECVFTNADSPGSLTLDKEAGPVPRDTQITIRPRSTPGWPARR